MSVLFFTRHAKMKVHIEGLHKDLLALFGAHMHYYYYYFRKRPIYPRKSQLKVYKCKGKVAKVYLNTLLNSNTCILKYFP